MLVVREGQAKGRGSHRPVAVLSTCSFKAAGDSKDAEQAPAPVCGHSQAGIAALLWRAGLRDGCRDTGVQRGSGRPLGSAGVGSRGGQLRITSHGFGPGSPSLALACSRTLRANLHCTGPCACNSCVGIVPMLHAIAGCWSHWGELLSSASPSVLASNKDFSPGHVVQEYFFSRVFLKVFHTEIRFSVLSSFFIL